MNKDDLVKGALIQLGWCLDLPPLDPVRRHLLPSVGTLSASTIAVGT